MPSDAITNHETASPASEPIPMLLYCPQCGQSHIDEPDERTPDWDNPPHRSHLCHDCGCIWRPADVPTVGVATIATRGKADTWPTPEGGNAERAASPASEDGVGRVSKEPCPCGHKSCKDWHLVGIGKFVQGSGFSEEEADKILDALASPTPRETLVIHSRGPNTPAMVLCAKLADGGTFVSIAKMEKALKALKDTQQSTRETVNDLGLTPAAQKQMDALCEQHDTRESDREAKHGH
jgi:hypothetical protein